MLTKIIALRAVETYLLLWTLPIVLLVLLALSKSLWPAIRVLALGSAVFLAWLAWALHGANWIATRLTSGIRPSSTAAADGEKASEALELLQRLGVTGDLFGGINALFAALAFGGVAIAAYLQFGTNRQAQVQTFEGAFFSAVDLLHRIGEGLQFDDSILDSKGFDIQVARLRLLAGGKGEQTARPICSGREVFPALVSGIARRANTPEAVSEKYRLLQTEHNYVLGHYFRHLYQVLKLIDRQSEEVIDKRRKESYASMLRAQLSTSELALLLLNCTGDMVDQGQFRNLLVKYRMLEHLPYFQDGAIYKTREGGLVLGDLETMQQFLVETEIPSLVSHPRGAFGANPVAIAHTADCRPCSTEMCKARSGVESNRTGSSRE